MEIFFYKLGFFHYIGDNNQILPLKVSITATFYYKAQKIFRIISNGSKSVSNSAVADDFDSTPGLRKKYLEFY